MISRFFPNQLRLLALLMLITACGRTADTPVTTEASPNTMPDTLTIPAAQQAQGGFRFARISQQTITQTIEARGQVEVPPSNLASVSSPLAGFVRKVDWLQGMRIRKGQILTVIDNPDVLLPMQQSYLESQARLAFLDAEYARNRTLVDAEVGAERNLQQVDAERKQLQARVAGLAAQLSAMGVAVHRLSASSLQRQVAIVAPISGVITQVNINLGKRIEPTDVLFQIVDPAHQHIELRVFEQDLPKLRKGQSVQVRFANTSERHAGVVYLVNAAIDEGQGTRVHVHLLDEAVERSLVPGMHLSAEITVSEVRTLAVPTVAVGHAGEQTFLWQQTGPDRVRAVAVTVAPLNQQWVRIVNPQALDTTATYLMGNVQLLK